MQIALIIAQEQEATPYRHEKAKWSQVAKKYAKCNKALADEGIIRYFRASDKLELPYDYWTVLEIIKDADSGRQIWKESVQEFKKRGL